MMVINKVAAFYLPSNTKSRIKALEKVKGDRPELSEVIDARIPDLERRLEYFKEPVKFREESLVTLGSALDVVEERLSEGGGPFICGEDYTLADVCFTCVVARCVPTTLWGSDQILLLCNNIFKSVDTYCTLWCSLGRQLVKKRL